MAKQSQGVRKRKIIFDKYADNLELLIANGIVTGVNLKYDRVYICPICKEQFPEAALDQICANPLTLEDAPPKSLGGTASVLTCRRCNNSCGLHIDHHLSSRMQEMDNHAFLPGVEFDAKFLLNGKKVQGTIRVDDARNMTVIHENKTNNPADLSEFIGGAKKGVKLNIEFLDTKANPLKLQLALLKSGFLMTFAKYGYSFILSEPYDRIREQLLQPGKEIYPNDFWFQTSFPEELFGVPFLTSDKIECVFPIFPLSTKHSSRIFGTIIPLTNQPIEHTIAAYHNYFAKHGEFLVKGDPMAGADYLTDIGAIMQMLNWIEGIAKKLDT